MINLIMSYYIDLMLCCPSNSYCRESCHKEKLNEVKICPLSLLPFTSLRLRCTSALCLSLICNYCCE